MTDFATSSDGTRIAFESRGLGVPALVLVHGWSCHRGYWSVQLSELSAHCMVVAIDLAGHGESGCSRRDWTIGAFGADVAAVVRQLSLHEIVLVGHSMGADVVLHAARHLQSRVRGLIWVDQYTRLTGFMSEAEVAERVAPFAADYASVARSFVSAMFSSAAEPDLVEHVCEDVASARPEIAITLLEATWNHARSVPDLLRELDLPVVAINAPNLRADAESLLRHGVQVFEMPGVGHFPMLEQPAAFNALLDRAIRQICGQRSDA
jgi:pimeloyl-ACP methyl ester carboxylesterase